MEKLLAGLVFIVAGVFSLLTNLVSGFPKVQALANANEGQVYALFFTCGAVGLMLTVIGGTEVKRKKLEAGDIIALAQLEQKLKQVQSSMHNVVQSLQTIDATIENTLQSWISIKSAGLPDYKDQLKDIVKKLSKRFCIELNVVAQANTVFQDALRDIDNAIKYQASRPFYQDKASARQLAAHITDIADFEVFGQTVIEQVNRQISVMEHLPLRADLERTAMPYFAELRRCVYLLEELVNLYQRLRITSEKLIKL